MHALFTYERVFRLRLAPQASELKWISLEVPGKTSESDNLFLTRFLYLYGTIFFGIKPHWPQCLCIISCVYPLSLLSILNPHISTNYFRPMKTRESCVGVKACRPRQIGSREVSSNQNCVIQFRTKHFRPHEVCIHKRSVLHFCTRNFSPNKSGVSQYRTRKISISQVHFIENYPMKVCITKIRPNQTIQINRKQFACLISKSNQ